MLQSFWAWLEALFTVLSTYCVAAQSPREHIQTYGILLKPEFYDIDWFPSVKRFEQNFAEIRKEVEKMLPARVAKDAFRRKDEWTQNASDFVTRNVNVDGWVKAWQAGSCEANSSWLNFPLMYKGQEFPHNTEKCPHLTELLRLNSERINIAGLSLMRPHSEIRPHRDTTGPPFGSLAYHLGLVVPVSKDCSLTVNGKTVHQREGQSIVFDSTYVHSAKNQSDFDRIILYIDFKTAR